MKRNFFKKLSFVLASAMVLTTLAPASGALAAGGPKLNSTKKYLHLGRVEEGTNEFNFNIKNKGKGWKYEWTSANQDVAKVNAKNGVTTATGVGSTKVTVVISDKDGEELEKLTAKVTVRDNIEVVKISNLPTEAIAVGEEYDFNRSYVTESGSSKKTSGITRWEVSPATATINDKGVFVASEAGEYTITANSFQSKAKYTDWLASEKKDADLVTATVSEKVTVAGGMVDAKQVDLDTFEVTFNTAVADVKDNLTVYQMVGEAKVKELIKKVEFDADKKVATVDMYTINEGATYVVDYPDMESVSFVAATADEEDVVSMKIKTTQVEVAEAKEIEVQLFDKNGVDITTDDVVNTRVTFETSSDDAILVGDELTMFKVGDTAQITATFHSNDYDSKTGEELGNLKAVGVIRCVEDILDVVGNIKAYTIEDNGVDSPDFDDVKHTFAADYNNKKLFVQLEVDAADIDDFDFTNVPNDADTEEKLGSDYYDKFEFKSSNESVLLVDENYGDLIPLKAGVSVVVVKYDGKTVGAVSITVTSDRKLATAKLDTTKVSLSNGFADEARIGVTTKDQYGDDFDVLPLVEVDKFAKGADDTDFTAVEDNGDVLINTTPGAPAGTYTVKVTVEDGDVKRVTYVAVEVKTPGDISYYAIETNKANYDLKLKDDESAPEVEISVYAYDKKGIKVDKLKDDLIPTLVKLNKAPNADDTFEFDVVINEAKIALTDDGRFEINDDNGVVSGPAIMKAPTGTYQLTAKASDGKYSGYTLRSAAFKVVDTQVKPVVVIDDSYTDEPAVVEAIKECITVKLDGKSQNDAGIVIPENSDYIKKTDKTVYVKKILFKQTIKGLGDIYHEVKVERTIRYNQ